MQSLLSLKAEYACIKALNSSDENMQRGALATIKFMHSERIVDALISAAKSDHKLKTLIIETLMRLHQKEINYDGSLWWSTKPDPDGPYYYPVNWAATDKISSFLNQAYVSLKDADKSAFVAQLRRNKAYVPELNQRPKKVVKKGKKVGTTSIEDLVLYVSKNKGNAKRGAKVINKIGCANCHNIKRGQKIKGPDLTKLGHVDRGEIAASIKNPGAIIAESWVSITMKDGKTTHIGTVVKKNAKEITLHNIAGFPTVIDARKVAKIAPGAPLMGEGLCKDLTLPEFANLIAYIKSIDSSSKK